MAPPPDVRRVVPRWLLRSGIAGWLAIGLVAAVALAIALVILASDVTVPVTVAAFLALVLAPIVDRLERRHVPRPIGSILVILGIGAVVAGAIALTAVGIGAERERLSTRIDQASERIEGWWDELDPDTVQSVRETIEAMGDDAGAGGVIGAAAGVSGWVVALAAGLLLGLMVLYYLLKDGHRLAAWATRRSGEPEAAIVLLRGAARDAQRYAWGRTLLAFVQAVVITLAAVALGVPLAATVGFVNFVGAYVPYLGALVGGALAVLLGIAAGGLPLGLAMLAIVLVVNLVIENALEPRLVGSVLGLHPLVVLVVTVAGGLFAGLVGLILAAPAAAIARRTFAHVRQTGFFLPDP